MILERTQQLLDRGREPLIVLQNLTSFYRDLLIAKTAPDRRDLVAITETTWAHLCDFAHQIDTATILAGQQHLRTCEHQVKQTTQPRLWLEVALLGLLPQPQPTVSAGLAPQPVTRPQTATHLHSRPPASPPSTASPAPVPGT